MFPIEMMTGYSDRINHAFAFAAKHHDRQVRKGTRLPYLTHPANVAIILTRYGRDEDTVVAGILHDLRKQGERVLFESFIVKDDEVGQRFKTALIAAAERGVAVFVIYDVFANLVVRRAFFDFPGSVNVVRCSSGSSRS